MDVKLLQASDIDVVLRAYGICTGKERIAIGNIAKWIKLGHESPLEHWVATFHISGISRSCSHQLVRHRIASHSQTSMRYVNMLHQDIVTPPDIMLDERAMTVFRGAALHAAESYRRLLELGLKKEDARFVLPIATQTGIIVTMNARSLRNFFKLRLDKAAQWEIRELAGEMFSLAYSRFPEAFADMLNLVVGESK